MILLSFSPWERTATKFAWFSLCPITAGLRYHGNCLLLLVRQDLSESLSGFPRWLQSKSTPGCRLSEKKPVLYFKLLILVFIEKCVMLKLIIASQVIGEIFTKWINMIATKIMIGTICALETMKWIIREYCSSPIYICIYLVASELIDTAYHCYIGNILPWTNQLVCFIKKSNYFHLDCITYFAYITLTFLIVRQLHVLDTAKFRMILI